MTAIATLRRAVRNRDGGSVAHAPRLHVWPACSRFRPASTADRVHDGFKPTPPQKLAGTRIDPAMSDPCAIGTMPAVIAAIPLPVDPPAE
jgi:hypothetical protein